jgi:hypothetical protein
MIGILSKNVTSEWKIKHVREIDIRNPVDISGLFIDWIPKLPEYEVDWMKQASILQYYIKHIPVVIFDRYFSLNEREIGFVKKYDVKLFEPALNSNRYGFTYLPEWIDSLEIENDEVIREYDLIYPNLEHSIKEFDKWIGEYSLLFTDKNIGYSTKINIPDSKKEEYRKKFLNETDKGYESGKTTLVIDRPKAYKMGYLNSKYFTAMRYGCLPILPAEHKYFHGLFKGLIVEDLKDLDYIVSMFGKLKDIIIEEIFDRIKKDWSEFTVEHTIDVIKGCLNE